MRAPRIASRPCAPASSTTCPSPWIPRSSWPWWPAPPGARRRAIDALGPALLRALAQLGLLGLRLQPGEAAAQVPERVAVPAVAARVGRVLDDGLGLDQLVARLLGHARRADLVLGRVQDVEALALGRLQGREVVGAVDRHRDERAGHAAPG